MSDSVKPTTDSGPDLQRELKRIEEEVAKTRAAMKSGKRMRLGIFVVFLVLLCLIVGSFYRLVKEFQSPQNLEVLVAELQKQASDRSDLFVKEAQTLMENSSPHFTKALADRAKADAPLYASAIDEQRLSLVANLREGLERQIDHHYSEGIKKHQVILESEFPKLRDAQIFQRFSLNLQVAIESLLKKYYSEEMEREFGVLFDTWETFPMAESPVGDEPPLEDQLLGNLLELAQSHLSRPSLSIETILDPLADTNE